MVRSASFSADLATILRPWGLLTFVLLAYAGYTIHDAWRPTQRAIARLATLPQIAMPPLQQLLPLRLQAPRLVLKCMADGTITYSDNSCDAGEDAEAILLAD